jgi:hypothetical protein
MRIQKKNRASRMAGPIWLFQPKKIGLSSLEVVLEHQLDITMALLRKTVNQVGVGGSLVASSKLLSKTERVI